MTYKARGTVKEVGETQEFGTNGFTKRELVVDCSDDPKYSSPVPFQFKKANTAKLDGVHNGDVVEVTFAIGGREWKGKYYGDITGLSVNVETTATAAANETVSAEDMDDLPF